MSNEELKYILNTYWTEFNYAFYINEDSPQCEIISDLSKETDEILKRFLNELEPVNCKILGSCGLYNFKDVLLYQRMFQLQRKIYDCDMRKIELSKDFE